MFASLVPPTWLYKRPTKGCNHGFFGGVCQTETHKKKKKNNKKNVTWRYALGRLGFTTFQKITSTLRQLAYGITADMFDEYLKMGEKTSYVCLNNFFKCIIDLYGREYLRKPTATDIARLYSAHEEKRGFKGTLGSIDCIHWGWKNCPVAWKGQYTRGDHGHPMIMHEAVTSYDRWIWHAFFGMAGSNNAIIC
ncbi:uncharacterized protein [Rutidosis leptorrhynchoides]|uniref:uncharacterized protein n=1 Tax=Rutidosis leptorrhynchoides TaxID=125765 RepID=UPI003A9A0A25